MTNGIVPIPAAWRSSVCRILRKRINGTIISRERAGKGRLAISIDSWDYEWFDAMASALAVDGIVGRVVAMYEEGETYEFFFSFNDLKMYCKINLLPNGKIIIIYSNHPPKRENL
jgi:hypothetical protein